MSEQYDNIATAYAALHPSDHAQLLQDYPLGVVEMAQMRTAVEEVGIRDKTVLDLACGSGNYSMKYLIWGAASVTGVDISSGMVQEARRQAESHGIPASKLTYQVGDASDPNLRVNGAPFDVVTAVYLLNYAPDCATMRRMFETVGRHLKPGGTYVSLAIPPLSDDLAAERHRLRQAFEPHGIWGRHALRGAVLGELPNDDGLRTRIELGLPVRGQEVARFENYYLRRELYERACRESGMFGGLEWREFSIPEDVRKSGLEGDWDNFAEMPGCRVSVARRLG